MNAPFLERFLLLLLINPSRATKLKYNFIFLILKIYPDESFIFAYVLVGFFDIYLESQA